MPLSARKIAANTFVEHIRRSNALHLEYLHDSQMLTSYEELTSWQHDYLLPFFSDLFVHDNYEEAVEFVVSDLSGTSIASRDRDLERAAPLFIRLLPTMGLQTLATGAEMNVRVLEINTALCRRLLEDGVFPGTLSESDYLRALRASTTLDECLGIINVLSELGENLDRLVRVPLISGTLRAMRRPAHAMGYGALHGFLSSGFNTFKAIPDVPAFLEIVLGRAIEVFENSFTAPTSADIT